MAESELRRQYLQHVREWDSRVLGGAGPAYDPQHDPKWTAEELDWAKPEELSTVLDILKQRTQLAGFNASCSRAFMSTAVLTTPFQCALRLMTSQICAMDKRELLVAELELLQWVRELIGFSAPYVGAITSGSSAANIICILEARLQLNTRQNDVSSLVVYVTKLSHWSVRRALIVAGIGSCEVRNVNLNGLFVMDPQHLERLIQADVKVGLKPFLIVSTFGYTVTTNSDDIMAIATIAHTHKLWHHVDAAAGGLSLIDGNRDSKHPGLNMVDSVNLSFHKSFLEPCASAAILIKRSLVSPDHIVEVSTGSTVGLLDTPLEMTTIQMQRAYLIWMSLKTMDMMFFPKSGYKMNLVKKCLAKCIIEHEDLTLHSEGKRNVTFYCKGESLAEANDITGRLAEFVRQQGTFLLAANEIDGYKFISISLLNPFVTHQQLQHLLEEIQLGLSNLLLKDAQPFSGFQMIEEESMVLENYFESDRHYHLTTTIPRILNVCGDTKQIAPQDLIGEHKKSAISTPLSKDKKSLPVLLSDYACMSGGLTSYVGGGLPLSNGGAMLDKHMLELLATSVGYGAGTVGGSFYDDMIVGYISALMCAKQNYANTLSSVLYVVGTQREELSRAVAVALLHRPIVRVYSRIEATQPHFVEAFEKQIQQDKERHNSPLALFVDYDHESPAAPAHTTHAAGGECEYIRAVVQLGRSCELWTHVSVQSGAHRLLLGDKYRVTGLRRSDSATINLQHPALHPKSLAAVLVKDGSILQESIMLGKDMNVSSVVKLGKRSATTRDVCLDDYTLELSRPARSLPLWFVYKILGLEVAMSYL